MEEDLVVMMSGLLALLALMPILPAHIASYLNDLFEVFRLASVFIGTFSFKFRGVFFLFFF